MVQFCSLYSGSTGNSLFLKSKDTKILIDAGVSCKKIVTALNNIGEEPQNLDAILITHEHKDHVQGIKVLSKKFGIPIYANTNTWNEIDNFVGDSVQIENRNHFITGDKFRIKDVEIKAFLTSHDAVEPVGFNFFVEDKKITTVTDLGYISKEMIENIDMSDFIFLESNHDKEMLRVGEYPWFLKQRILSNEGHLSNEVAGRAVAYFSTRGTKKFTLGHLSKQNNFPELAFETVKSILANKNIDIDSDISLSIAPSDIIGEISYI